MMISRSWSLRRLGQNGGFLFCVVGEAVARVVGEAHRLLPVECIELRERAEMPRGTAAAMHQDRDRLPRIEPQRRVGRIGARPELRDIDRDVRLGQAAFGHQDTAAGIIDGHDITGECRQADDSVGVGEAAAVAMGTG